MQADNKFKIFCDESCHLDLQKDLSNVMVLGALSCPEEKVEHLTRAIKYLRHKHQYYTELKWTKLIAKQFNFYREVLDLFLNSEDVLFKATVVVNKKYLNHDEFNHGSHNNFYYKMFFYALRDFIHPGGSYKIYLDYMDTQGRDKARKLIDVLENSNHGTINAKAYIIRSHESQLIQLCDLLIGALSYANREDIERKSAIKNELVSYLEQRLCRQLTVGTPPWEEKFNIFRFSPRRKSC
jgi:hypothetical protein